MCCREEFEKTKASSSLGGSPQTMAQIGKSRNSSSNMLFKNKEIKSRRSRQVSYLWGGSGVGQVGEAAAFPCRPIYFVYKLLPYLDNNAH